MSVEFFRLNFEGADEATEWSEEINDLEVDYQQGCEIDTAQHYAGASSLLMTSGAQFYYSTITGVDTENFDLSIMFRLSALLSGADHIQIYIEGESGPSYSSVSFDLYADDLDITVHNDSIGDWLTYSEAQSYSIETWHELKISVSGRDVSITVDDVELLAGTAWIDDPLAGLYFLSVQLWCGTSLASLWVDDVVIGSNFSGVPSASATLTGHAPLRSADIPVANSTLTAFVPLFGPAEPISVPAALATLLARIPSPVWIVPVERRGSAQMIFYCTLTGAADGLDDIILPLASFQARMRDGEPSYVSCVIPASTTCESAIAARTHGEIIIQKGFRFADGTEQMEEISRVDYESVQIDRGARSDSLVISGHKTVASSSPKEWTVSGVSFYGVLTDGKRRVRADMDLFLRVGDTCIYGTGENDYFVVGMIAYWVSAVPTALFMEAQEA